MLEFFIFIFFACSDPYPPNLGGYHPQKNSTRIWAVRMRRNIDNG